MCWLFLEIICHLLPLGTILIIFVLFHIEQTVPLVSPLIHLLPIRPACYVSDVNQNDSACISVRRLYRHQLGQSLHSAYDVSMTAAVLGRWYRAMCEDISNSRHLGYVSLSNSGSRRYSRAESDSPDIQYRLAPVRFLIRLIRRVACPGGVLDPLARYTCAALRHILRRARVAVYAKFLDRCTLSDIFHGQGFYLNSQFNQSAAIETGGVKLIERLLYCTITVDAVTHLRLLITCDSADKPLILGVIIITGL